MRRVLRERQNCRRNLSPESVHDLRIALRRCIAIAEDMQNVDPAPEWKSMRRAARRLMKRLGDLRDSQVLLALLVRIAGTGVEMGKSALEEYLKREQAEAMSRAVAALKQFDRKRWKSLAEFLPGRIGRLALDGPVVAQLALERFEEAHALHRQALRNRSRVGFHRLRIALKGFRYTAENLLPGRYAGWKPELVRAQDCLGEMHDLDTLWKTVKERSDLRGTSRAAWKMAIDTERAERLRSVSAEDGRQEIGMGHVAGGIAER